MKIVTLYSFLLILSTLLIVLTLTEYMQDSLFFAKRKEIRVQKSKKNSLKRREEFIPIRTLESAQKAIDAKLYLLDNSSVKLEQNMSRKGSIDTTKVTLSNLVRVLNNLDEEAILVINTYSDQNGSKAYNLELSQKHADILKEYFRERTSLPLIVAIGYGKSIHYKKENNTTHRQVEINLKRIK